MTLKWRLMKDAYGGNFTFSSFDKNGYHFMNKIE